MPGFFYRSRSDVAGRLLLSRRDGAGLDSVFTLAFGAPLCQKVGSLGVLAALIRVIRAPPRQIVRRLAWLAVLVAFSLWMLHRQVQTAAEAIHFVEYGILGFLLFRAWRHHMQEPLLYPVAALSLVIIAWADEFLQWLTVGRFWDFRDIRLNLLAGLVPLVLIAGVIVPAGIQRPVARASVRRLCYLSWMTLLALGLSISATPRRIDALASRIPSLGFLYNNESVMIEYGYRHDETGIGVFKSRLTLPELQRAAAGRGREAGARLAQHPALADRREFCMAFAASADPVLHEMGMHLFQRNHFYDVCWQYRTSDPARFVHMTVVARENRILEPLFSRALEGAGQRRFPAQSARYGSHTPIPTCPLSVK